eukprot:c31974_g1_i1 orf=168-359(-)
MSKSRRIPIEIMDGTTHLGIVDPSWICEELRLAQAEDGELCFGKENTQNLIHYRPLLRNDRPP